ncbi:hypothetical protein GH714_031601 [Hevea brasiliensis]|uniref:NPH3 domain-containing protein n=1 Tax=Hevea brasiliensis TaxID=3981 RepID=A0A6A6L4W6_HEVBR|nr:hypothetical protein GH714_031601 [Hevea brasiliensis]
MPLAESLGIAQRCIDSIASRASSADPTLFGWPVSDGANENRATSNQALWNGIESAVRRKGAASASTDAPPVAINSCHESERSECRYYRELLNVLCQEVHSRHFEIEPKAIIVFLYNLRERTERGIGDYNFNLPLEKGSRSSTATRFLFGLLRTANILNASESCRSALEKKIGSQLEQATLDDLLIPSYSYLNETLYDVDCVERILSYFLDGLEERNATGIEAEKDGDRNVRSPAIMLVGKLIDGYLAEIASDANLKPDRFYNLAISLPEQARLFDDGLYRAVDVYLKAHPWISEAEREKICGVMDCQKLTLEACTHAAQNERLPLRAVVQVLFFEQLQLRHAIAGTLIAADAAPQDFAEQEGVEEGAVSAAATAVAEEAQDSSNTWKAAVRENQVLRLDMDSMRTRVRQLERECSTMKKAIEKIDKVGPRGWRRFGCKFKTQVCDSHEQTVVNARKGRHHHHQQ